MFEDLRDQCHWLAGPETTTSRASERLAVSVLLQSADSILMKKLMKKLFLLCRWVNPSCHSRVLSVAILIGTQKMHWIAKTLLNALSHEFSNLMLGDVDGDNDDESHFLLC